MVAPFVIRRRLCSAEHDRTQILRSTAKWHTLCPPLSILFILGAVSPADDAAVMRKGDLLQLRDDFLRWLVHTSVIPECAASLRAASDRGCIFLLFSYFS